MLSSNERRLQTHGVTWLKTTLPHVLVIAVINELPQTAWGEGFSEEFIEAEKKANLIRMVLMKGMGLYPGAADLILLWHDGKQLQIRFLETKDKAPQSVNQEKFQKRVEGMGCIYNIWRTLRELEALCRSWGLMPATPTPKGDTPLTKKQLMGGMMHEFNLEMYGKKE